MDERLSDIDRKLDEMDNESQNDFKRYYGKQLHEIRPQELCLPLQALVPRFML